MLGCPCVVRSVRTLHNAAQSAGSASDIAVGLNTASFCRHISGEAACLVTAHSLVLKLVALKRGSFSPLYPTVNQSDARNYSAVNGSYDSVLKIQTLLRLSSTCASKSQTDTILLLSFPTLKCLSVFSSIQRQQLVNNFHVPLRHNSLPCR
jgi:hypothetical protein